MTRERNRFRLPATLAAVLLAVAMPLSAQVPTSAAEPMPPNPFAGFETLRLANGLRVWYGYLPASTLTSMALVVPWGRDQDPPGREQAAHFLEHVLLSDRHGRTEAELARELTGRGGSHNGVTGPRYTYYPLSIGTDQAAFGLEWLHQVVAPRRIGEDLVQRNREPVAIELSARRGGMFGGWLARYLAHPALLPAPFWKREFGIAAQDERGADQHAALARITAADLQRFFDTYYAPSEMTLVIVSGAPREALQPVLDATFATLPWRPVPESRDSARLRSAETRLFQYRAGSSTRISVRYRIAGMDGLDQLRLAFIEDLLRYRLMERLRRGADKSIYSISTATTMRGPAAFFAIVADMNPAQERAVRAIIDDELRRIGDATSNTAAFYADRDALSRRLRVENASPAALRGWALDRFLPSGLHERFPDVGEYYAVVGPDSVAALASRVFTQDNRILYVWRPLPLPAAVLVLLAFGIVAATVRIYRRATLRPADMGRIRFVAHLRPTWPARIATAAAVAALVLLGGRLLAAALHIAAQEWLLTVDSVLPPFFAAAALLFAGALAGIAAIGRMHTKVLVFDDELRIKSPTYRAITLHLDHVRDVRVVSAATGLRLRHFVMPPVGRGVFIEVEDGGGYLLRSRKPERLAGAIEEALRRRQPVAEPVLEYAPA